MGWRKIVHKLTNRCMARSTTFQMGEVTVKLGTTCDGETLEGCELYKFGELVDWADGHPESVAAVARWIEHEKP